MPVLTLEITSPVDVKADIGTFTVCQSNVAGRARDSSFVFSGVLDRIGGLVAQRAWLDDNQARVD